MRLTLIYWLCGLIFGVLANEESNYAISNCARRISRDLHRRWRTILAPKYYQSLSLERADIRSSSRCQFRGFRTRESQFYHYEIPATYITWPTYKMANNFGAKITNLYLWNALTYDRHPGVNFGVLGHDKTNCTTTESLRRKRGRCVHCHRAKDNKVSNKCSVCNSFISMEHSVKTTNYKCKSCPEIIDD
jgi:hypothetical protein